MGEKSTIEWTDATWNPWQGCTKVSPACANCYMFRDMKRYGRDGSVIVRSQPATFNLPLKKTRDHQVALKPGTKVFTCSWSDWFHESADPWRDDAWEIIRQRPELIFQIVTKRTERIADHLPADWGNGYPNVWLIATAENQQWMRSRLTDLEKIPCTVRGLSVEPMLGPIELLASDPIDWVIVGGESGPGARPMHPEWVLRLRARCLIYGVAFFFKQWGEWLPLGHNMKVNERNNQIITIDIDGKPNNDHLNKDGVVTFQKRGKHEAGRLLDGLTWNQFPKIRPENVDENRG